MQHVDALSRVSVLKISVLIFKKMIKAQKEDEKCYEIVHTIELGGNCGNFVFTNGLLYKETGRHKIIYVPRSMEVEIVRRAHEQGYFEVKKTMERLREEYYIPNVEENINDCINNCVECILSEKKRGKAESHLQPIPKGDVPLDTFHMDHLGPMPSTRKSYNYILTIIDAFT